MENYANNLQEKIQKLIDQYTSIKKKHDDLIEENNLLTEQNMQLIEQIELHNAINQDTASNLEAITKELQLSKEDNSKLNSELILLKQSLQSFESIASEALSKIDVIFPDFEES